jgi:hypothetical protein
MSVPATLLLMQVSRQSYQRGGWLPPDPEDEETKRRKRWIRRALIAFSIVGTLALVGYFVYKTHQAGEQMKVMFAPSPRA